jgi:cephalosporin-C deacetylase
METIPLGQERVLNTVAYYDTMNVATKCLVPTQMSMGLKDPSCRPPNLESVFAALPGHKRQIVYPGGHDWDPAMVENNRQWLSENLQ